MTIMDGACRPRLVLPIDLNKRLIHTSPAGITTLVDDVPWGYGLASARSAPFATRSPACP